MKDAIHELVEKISNENDLMFIFALLKRITGSTDSAEIVEEILTKKLSDI